MTPMIIVGIQFTNGHVVEGSFCNKKIALDAFKGLAATIKRYPGTIRNIWTR